MVSVQEIEKLRRDLEQANNLITKKLTEKEIETNRAKEILKEWGVKNKVELDSLLNKLEEEALSKFNEYKSKLEETAPSLEKAESGIL